MLSVLRSRFRPSEKVWKIDYRNLAAIYVNEPMRVCVRLVGNEDEIVEGKTRKWEVWVEGPDGGLSVRGTAISLKENTKEEKQKKEGEKKKQEEEKKEAEA